MVSVSIHRSVVKQEKEKDGFSCLLSLHKCRLPNCASCTTLAGFCIPASSQHEEHEHNIKLVPQQNKSHGQNTLPQTSVQLLTIPATDAIKIIMVIKLRCEMFCNTV